MTHFTPTPTLRPIPGDPHHRFVLTKPVKFYYGRGRKPGTYALLPAGATTNFGSFGPVRWLFRAYSSDYGLAALVHDAMTGEFGQPPAHIFCDSDPEYFEVPTWEEAAKWFYRAMKAHGTPWWKRKLFYHTVLLYKHFKHVRSQI